MTVTKLKNGKWLVDVTVGKRWDGKRDRRTKRCATKKQAMELDERWNAEKLRSIGVATRMTLGDYVEHDWWPTKVKSLQQTSLDSYEQDLRLRIMPHFGHVELERIDRLAVQRMINECSSYSTAKRARDLLRAILNDAIGDGVATKNAAAGRFTLPRRAEKPVQPSDRGVWLTTFAEHRAMLQEAQGAGEVEKIIVCGLCFGLRKEETLGLDVRDLDFERREIHVRRAYVKSSKGNILKPTKTLESERDLPMSDYAYTRLKALTMGLPPESPLCLSRYGRRLAPSTAYKMLKRWLEANGQPMVTMKTLRHSFASACIDAGVDIAKVSAWLGHTQITTTLNRYVKTVRKDMDGVIFAMGDVRDEEHGR